MENQYNTRKKQLQGPSPLKLVVLKDLQNIVLTILDIVKHNTADMICWGVVSSKFQMIPPAQPQPGGSHDTKHG